LIVRIDYKVYFVDI